MENDILINFLESCEKLYVFEIGHISYINKNLESTYTDVWDNIDSFIDSLFSLYPDIQDISLLDDNELCLNVHDDLSFKIMKYFDFVCVRSFEVVRG